MQPMVPNKLCRVQPLKDAVQQLEKRLLEVVPAPCCHYNAYVHVCDTERTRGTDATCWVTIDGERLHEKTGNLPYCLDPFATHD
jgi:hypothetical protein